MDSSKPPSPRRHLPRAKPSSATMTPEMAHQARAIVIEWGYAQHQAAAILNVNPGRVNDAVHCRIFPS
jgi:hypothetical protein